MSVDAKRIEGTYTFDSTRSPFSLERTMPANGYRSAGAQNVRFVPVAKDVHLEVVDWGGTERPLVLLSGLGSSAHVFNSFAPKLTNQYRVIVISRRGFGASTIASSGYRSDSLVDDVLAVLDSLKLDRPILAGWSLGGAEMSSIGTRYPKKVGGLVYLDAGYTYAFHDSTTEDLLSPTHTCNAACTNFLIRLPLRP